MKIMVEKNVVTENRIYIQCVGHCYERNQVLIYKTWKSIDFVAVSERHNKEHLETF